MGCNCNHSGMISPLHHIRKLVRSVRSSSCKLGSSSHHTLALLMAVFLFGTCWVASGTHSSPLKVANNLKDGPLTVLTPPGCCSPCGPDDPTVVCPAVCVQCRNVVVEERMVGRMDTHTPYPLPHLMIQVQEVVWCVDSGDLQLLKESVTLAGGPGACGANGAGLQAVAFVLHVERASRGKCRCLYVCNRY